MAIKNVNPESLHETLSEFQSLNKVLIDTSSIIYIIKTGFWALLTESIAVYTIPSVIQELGYPVQQINLLENSIEAESTDSELVCQGIKLNLAILTEDKKIHSLARLHQLPHFNTLMILLYLLCKKKINQSTYHSLYAQLLSHAWYSQRVIDYSAAILNEIMQGGRF